MEKLPGDALAIRVEQVSEDDFLTLKRQVWYKSGELEVDPDGWIADATDTPIINEGASVCAIVYAYCSANREMISGHFSDSERGIEVWPKTLVDAYPAEDEKLVKLLSGYVNHFNRYQSMLDYIRELAGKYGSGHMEAHIFGQNFRHSPISIGTTLIERAKLDFDLRYHGVPKDRIGDYRTLGFDTDADHTLYLPSTGTIYRLLEPYNKTP